MVTRQLILNIGLQPWTAHYLRIQALGGQHHDRVRHGCGRFDVFFADTLRLCADGSFKSFFRSRESLQVLP